MVADLVDGRLMKHTDSNCSEVEQDRQERVKGHIWFVLQRSSEHGPVHIDMMGLNVQIPEEGIRCSQYPSFAEVIDTRSSSTRSSGILKSVLLTLYTLGR